MGFLKIFDSIRDLILGALKHIKKIIDVAFGLDDDEIKGIMTHMDEKKIAFFKKTVNSTTIIREYKKEPEREDPGCFPHS